LIYLLLVPSFPYRGQYHVRDGFGGGGGAGGGFGFEIPGFGVGVTAFPLSTRLGWCGGGCGAFSPITVPPNNEKFHLRLIS
jgi:hypothetical protein